MSFFICVWRLCMNSFFFLLHRELHLSDFILDSISGLQWEAASTSTSGIDFTTGEDPFLPGMRDPRSIERCEILSLHRESEPILLESRVGINMDTFFYTDLVSCAASVGHDDRYVRYMSLFPGSESLGIELYHRRELYCYFFGISDEGNWYFHMLSFPRTRSHHFCCSRLGIVDMSHASMSHLPVVILGYFSHISVI